MNSKNITCSSNLQLCQKRKISPNKSLQLPLCKHGLDQPLAVIKVALNTNHLGDNETDIHTGTNPPKNKTLLI